MDTKGDTPLFDQSDLVRLTLSMTGDVPGMIGAVKEYLAASKTALRHGDIGPLYEDIVVILLQWTKDGQSGRIREFLGQLQSLLLTHPGFNGPALELSPEKHLTLKMSALADILGILLRRGVA